MTNFENPYAKKVKKKFWDLVLWKLGYYKDHSKGRQAPNDFQYPRPNSSFDPERPSAVWVGHSTFLIQYDGFNVLTDPIWSKWCSPIPFFGLKRHHKPPFLLDSLPPIDFVLISHNHYDHLDLKTVKALNKRHPGCVWVVSKGMKTWFEKRHIRNVYELNWGESLEFQKEERKIKIFATPCQHFSGRTLRDFNKTGWNGYVVQMTGSPTKTFYFVGDTGYNEFHFKEIGKNFPSIDLSLIPIGSYSPREFMKQVHVCPEEAVKIHSEVNSALSLAMHWKTFHLSDEPITLPPYDLYLAMKEKGLALSSFLAVEPGQHVNW